MNVNEIIMNKRIERGVSRKELAEGLGVSESTIYRIETNPNLPIDFPPILIFSRNFRCQMPNPYVLPLFLPLPAETRANSLLPDYHIQQLR